MLPRIFVGGTGRSCTWRLYKTLGNHKDVHTFPAEMRFTIDPGGLMDLYDALTTRYAPIHSRSAIIRFERLMRVHVATPGTRPYARLNFPEWLGGEAYERRLDQFLDAVIEAEFDSKFAKRENHDGRLVRFARRLQAMRNQVQGDEENEAPDFHRDTLPVARYFSDPEALAAVMAAFVDDIFMQGARQHGKQTWCEKTPQHLLHLSFIWQLFPDSVFIHIKRDPRGVVNSLTQQPWAPSDLRNAAFFLRNIYQRWLDLKPTLNLEERNYLEIKLEDLALSTDKHLHDVMALCQLDGAFTEIPDIDIARVDYWKNKMTTEEIALVNEILGPQILEMGYEL